MGFSLLLPRSTVKRIFQRIPREVNTSWSFVLSAALVFGNNLKETSSGSSRKWQGERIPPLWFLQGGIILELADLKETRKYISLWSHKITSGIWSALYFIHLIRWQLYSYSWHKTVTAATETGGIVSILALPGLSQGLKVRVLWLI